MATVTKKMSPEQIEALYKRCKPLAKKEAQPQYTCWQLHLESCVISAYTSGKVVYQGADLSWLEDEPKEPKTTASSLSNTFPMAGSDEVGTGDYFGPVVVASTIVPDEKTAKALQALKITDSKAMTDAYIQKIAPQIKEMIPYSIQILDNKTYNETWHATSMNMNRIKARMHNQAYINLKNKGYALPELKVVDQFCAPKSYYAHLKGVSEIVDGIHFETKAESKYIAVAAASVLARNAFLETWQKMEEKYDFHFEKGAGAKTDANIRQFLKEHDSALLKYVAKLHFSNTQKATHGKKKEKTLF
jgi:ribonuclease HIII